MPDPQQIERLEEAERQRKTFELNEALKRLRMAERRRSLVDGVKLIFSLIWLVLFYGALLLVGLVVLAGVAGLLLFGVRQLLQ
jgi:hypothetical protein